MQFYSFVLTFFLLNPNPEDLGGKLNADPCGSGSTAPDRSKANDTKTYF